MFHNQMKHLEVPQKKSAARRICNSLLGVFGDETRRLMLDILRHKETVERNQPSESDSWFHASFEHYEIYLW